MRLVSGKTASHALAVPFAAMWMLVAGCGDASDASDSIQATVQVHQGEAQGTTYSIKYRSEERIQQSVFDGLLEVVDREVNLWRPESTINQINAWERTDSLFGFIDSNQIIGPLWALSGELHEITRGAFDPTVKPLVELWGFGLSKRGEVSIADVDSVLEFTGLYPDRFDMNEEEENNRYVATWVRKGDGRSAIDFNAVAQGYTVDLLLEALRERGIAEAMVEL